MKEIDFDIKSMPAFSYEAIIDYEKRELLSELNLKLSDFDMIEIKKLSFKRRKLIFERFIQGAAASLSAVLFSDKEHSDIMKDIP